MKPLSLPDDICSPDEISEVIINLNDYQSALRDQAARAKVKSKLAATPPQPSAQLQTMLDTLSKDHTNPEELDQLRKQLEFTLNKAPIAHLTLAALPNLLIKKKLVAWFRREISPDMLITFAVRSDIGGGAIMLAGSHIYDFSFRNLLVANKARLAEIAARV